jgi:hemolysin activation/secretion protein
MGASLGGFERLRAFPTYRFSDKAALLYAAELRLTSSWDPGKWRLLKFFDVDWVQFVPFLEVGRVADSWSISELHKDVKWDVGLGLRFMMRKAVFRVEVAVGENDSSTWVMVGHPF